MGEVQEMDRTLQEAAFYNKPFYFSYSALNRLITAPNIFYKEYVLREREIKTDKYLLEGILIHHLLLEDQNFDDKFLISPEDLPSSNSMKVAQMIFEGPFKEKVAEDPGKADLELVDFPNEIDEILKEISLHQSVKDPQKRVAKIVEPRTEAYFNFLKKKGTREIIDSGTLDKCKRAADLIKTNEHIRELLGMDRQADGVTFGVYNELHVKMELPELPFGLQGILDNMTVDVKAKQIRINDFKTTGKSLNEFPDSVEYWNYWLQAAIYLQLAMEYLKEVIDDSWNFEVHFIVFDKYDQVYAFPVTNKSLVEWVGKSKEVIKEAKWHYENKDYTLPYKFIAGEVTL